MPDQEPDQPAPRDSPSERPAPPPYRPNKELIGYIERGQKPPKEEG
jgi:hypothetical protein